MPADLNLTRDHVVVAGYGRLGRMVCERFEEAGVPVAVVDREAQSLERARNSGFPAFRGDFDDESTWIKAGLSRARAVVITVEDVANAIVAAITVKTTRTDVRITARAETEMEMRKLRRAGVDRIISPLRTAGRELARTVIDPSGTGALEGSGMQRGAALAEIEIEKESFLTGLTLSEYGRTKATKVSYVALERKDEDVLIPPPGSEYFRAGDLIIVWGNPEQLKTMRDDAKGSKMNSDSDDRKHERMLPSLREIAKRQVTDTLPITPQPTE